VAFDVLQHHDRVVHDPADGDGERAQGEHVERVVATPQSRCSATITDSGMDTAVTSVDRTDSRKNRITSTAITRPSRPSVVRPSIDRSTNGAWSKTGVERGVPAEAAAEPGQLVLDGVGDLTALPSGVAVTMMPRLGLPLVRVMVEAGAVVSVTEATSPSLTGAALAGEVEALEVVQGASGVPTCTLSALSRRRRCPPGSGTPLARRAVRVRSGPDRRRRT
jgi:hypothetical protein